MKGQGGTPSFQRALVICWTRSLVEGRNFAPVQTPRAAPVSRGEDALAGFGPGDRRPRRERHLRALEDHGALRGAPDAGDAGDARAAQGEPLEADQRRPAAGARPGAMERALHGRSGAGRSSSSRRRTAPGRSSCSKRSCARPTRTRGRRRSRRSSTGSSSRKPPRAKSCPTTRRCWCSAISWSSSIPPLTA